MAIAEILRRQGVDLWQEQDQALLRAVEFLNAANFVAPDMHQWLLWVIDRRYGTTFAGAVTNRFDRNLGFTEWTHAK